MVVGYGTVSLSFWTDNKILNLKPDSRYVFLYLLANPNLTPCGYIEFPTQFVAIQTGLSPQAIDMAINDLVINGLILVEGLEIVIVNYSKYNWKKGLQNQFISVLKAAGRIKNDELKDFVMAKIFSFYGIDEPKLTTCSLCGGKVESNICKHCCAEYDERGQITNFKKLVNIKD